MFFFGVGQSLLPKKPNFFFNCFCSKTFRTFFKKKKFNFFGGVFAPHQKGSRIREIFFRIGGPQSKQVCVNGIFRKFRFQCFSRIFRLPLQIQLTSQSRQTMLAATHNFLQIIVTYFFADRSSFPLSDISCRVL